MENIPEISVIVPVFKVEKFLRRCLESIKEQTFSYWECILIDDGSPDNSGKICDEYAAKDGRFRVVHQDNVGTSATRERALKYATARYIQFVDSDDWIEPNMLECMFKKAIEADADMVGCNFIVELKNKQIKKNVFYTSKDVFIKDVLSNNWGVLWKLLIKRDIISNNDIHFPEHINGGEDYVFVIKCLWYCNKIICIDQYLYHYNCNNTESFISSPTFENMVSQYNATQVVEDFLTDKNELRFYETYLLVRKISVKENLLRYYFFATYHLWSQIDAKAIKDSELKLYKRLLFFLSFLFNGLKC